MSTPSTPFPPKPTTMASPTNPLESLLSGNAQWVQATDPELFKRCAEGQSPKVCVPFCLSPIVDNTPSRCSGSAARTRVSQRLSSRVPTRETFLSTATLQSTLLCYHLPRIDPPSYSQFHPNDDSALSVLTFAVGVVGVEHGRWPSCAPSHLCIHLLQSSSWDTPNAAVRARVSKPSNPQTHCQPRTHP